VRVVVFETTREYFSTRRVSNKVKIGEPRLPTSTLHINIDLQQQHSLEPQLRDKMKGESFANDSVCWECNLATGKKTFRCEDSECAYGRNYIGEPNYDTQTMVQMPARVHAACLEDEEVICPQCRQATQDTPERRDAIDASFDGREGGEHDLAVAAPSNSTQVTRPSNVGVRTRRMFAQETTAKLVSAAAKELMAATCSPARAQTAGVPKDVKSNNTHDNAIESTPTQGSEALHAKWGGSSLFGGVSAVQAATTPKPTTASSRLTHLRSDRARAVRSLLLQHQPKSKNTPYGSHAQAVTDILNTEPASGTQEVTGCRICGRQCVCTVQGVPLCENHLPPPSPVQVSPSASQSASPPGERPVPMIPSATDISQAYRQLALNGHNPNAKAFTVFTDGDTHQSSQPSQEQQRLQHRQSCPTSDLHVAYVSSRDNEQANRLSRPRQVQSYCEEEMLELPSNTFGQQWLPHDDLNNSLTGGLYGERQRSGDEEQREKPAWHTMVKYDGDPLREAVHHYVKACPPTPRSCLTELKDDHDATQAALFHFINDRSRSKDSSDFHEVIHQTGVLGTTSHVDQSRYQYPAYCGFPPGTSSEIEARLGRIYSEGLLRSGAGDNTLGVSVFGRGSSSTTGGLEVKMYQDMVTPLVKFEIGISVVFAVGKNLGGFTTIDCARRYDAESHEQDRSTVVDPLLRGSGSPFHQRSVPERTRSLTGGAGWATSHSMLFVRVVRLTECIAYVHGLYWGLAAFDGFAVLLRHAERCRTLTDPQGYISGNYSAQCLEYVFNHYMLTSFSEAVRDYAQQTAKTGEPILHSPDDHNTIQRIASLGLNGFNAHTGNSDSAPLTVLTERIATMLQTGEVKRVMAGQRSGGGGVLGGVGSGGPALSVGTICGYFVFTGECPFANACDSIHVNRCPRFDSCLAQKCKLAHSRINSRKLKRWATQYEKPLIPADARDKLMSDNAL
jgi:hypothetical protein